MFNGIIYNTGELIKIEKRSEGVNLFIKSNLKIKKKSIGMSISCDGVCLTLISNNKNVFEFFLSNETITRSKFSKSKKGDIINLELPMKYGQDISGHICQGHVDTTGKLVSIKKKDKASVYEVEVSSKFKASLVTKASILINGVSLTISKINKRSFELWLIPHTLKLTNLSYIKKGDLVNIEIDILSKYVKKFLNEK